MTATTRTRRRDQANPVPCERGLKQVTAYITTSTPYSRLCVDTSLSKLNEFEPTFCVCGKMGVNCFPVGVEGWSSKLSWCRCCCLCCWRCWIFLCRCCCVCLRFWLISDWSSELPLRPFSVNLLEKLKRTQKNLMMHCCCFVIKIIDYRSTELVLLLCISTMYIHGSCRWMRVEFKSFSKTCKIIYQEI